jgi:hypothetical protein
MVEGSGRGGKQGLEVLEVVVGGSERGGKQNLKEPEVVIRKVLGHNVD